MKIGYTLSDRELKTYEEAKERITKAHYLAKYPDGGTPEEWHKMQGMCGGCVTWMITPTGIGTLIQVKIYDEVVDLTDYTMW